MKIKLTSAAKQDIKDASDWYDNQKRGLGRDFKLHIIESIEKIIQNPLAFQKRYKDNRIKFTGKYPYGVHYSLTDKQIVIIAIFHTSRSSKIWKKR